MMPSKKSQKGKKPISDEAALTTLLFVLSGWDAERDTRVIRSFCSWFDITPARAIGLVKTAANASKEIH
jgi:hypothetical protein